MACSDESLVAAHVAGDLTAFDALVRRHGPGLYGYLLRMTGHRHQAEDLFQEVFRRIHEKAASFSGRGAFRAWMYAVASRAVIDAARKRRRDQSVVDMRIKEGERLDPATANPGAEAIAAERRARVRQALDALPPRQRETVILVYYRHLSHAEAARVIGCSIGSVKRHMFRALRSLSERLPDLREDAE
ncbi:MAG: hypothetical protein CMJ18_22255 [Phycisphaeraceae bacterium]|nr:hypothetical protein [Phycisphaeraceae bacterium]